jgi:hypothetical protein
VIGEQVLDAGEATESPLVDTGTVDLALHPSRKVAQSSSE